MFDRVLNTPLNDIKYHSENVYPIIGAYWKMSDIQDFVKWKSKWFTAKNIVISPNFLVIARNYAEIVPFHKISTPGN